MAKFILSLPMLASLVLTTACLSPDVAAVAQVAPTDAGEVIDVWESGMTTFAPAAERAKQVEIAIETRDRHNWPDTVVLNVTKPTLTVVRPTIPSNGAAIVVVPGGGFRVLSYANEGTRVADWFAARGFTAFILKYRLNPMPNDPAVLAGFGGGAPPPGAGAAPGAGATPAGAPAAPPPMRLSGPFEKDALADGLQAIATVRAKASMYGVDPDRVGIVGFSAGGSVSSSTAIATDPASRPNFVGIIYSRVTGDVPEGAPPAFFAAASDDSLVGQMPADFARWIAAGSKAEIHIYTKGEHGFGTVRQGLPVDGWINSFYDWIVQQGFVASGH